MLLIWCVLRKARWPTAKLHPCLGESVRRTGINRFNSFTIHHTVYQLLFLEEGIKLWCNYSLMKQLICFAFLEQFIYSQFSLQCRHVQGTQTLLGVRVGSLIESERTTICPTFKFSLHRIVKKNNKKENKNVLAKKNSLWTEFSLYTG